MTDGIGDIVRRVERLEEEMEKLEDLWKSSVDDIKATIKSEVGDLKREQIADLKQSIKDRDQNMAAYEVRMRAAEDAIRDWNAGRNLLGWLIKALIGVGSLGAGYLGAKHIG